MRSPLHAGGPRYGYDWDYFYDYSILITLHFLGNSFQCHIFAIYFLHFACDRCVYAALVQILLHILKATNSVTENVCDFMQNIISCIRRENWGTRQAPRLYRVPSL